MTATMRTAQARLGEPAAAGSRFAAGPRLGLLAGAALTGLAAARAYPLFGHLVPPCPWLFLTGTYCPGCGSGRMVLSAADGEIAAAFAYNPVAFVGALWVGWVVLAWALAPAGVRLPYARASSRASVAVGVVIVAWWVLRNVAGLGPGPPGPV